MLKASRFFFNYHESIGFKGLSIGVNEEVMVKPLSVSRFNMPLSNVNHVKKTYSSALRIKRQRRRNRHNYFQ